MNHCYICEWIEYVKRTGTKMNNISFKIALIEDSNRDGIFRGRLTHRAMKFRFCPICGKEYSKSSLYVRTKETKMEGVEKRKYVWQFWFAYC